MKQVHTENLKVLRAMIEFSCSGGLAPGITLLGLG